MRTKLLMTVAAVTLAIGMATAVAQSPNAQKAPPSDTKGPPDTPPDVKGPADKKGAGDKKGPATKKGPDGKAAPATKGPADKKGPGDTKAPAAQTAPAGQQAPDAKTPPDTKGPRAPLASVNITVEQRTRVRTIFVSQQVEKLRNVSFEIRVGTRVPRTTSIYDVPMEVITIVPEYRGYRYFIVEEQIIIIDPDTWEIVAILPA